MILILKPDADPKGPEYRQLMNDLGHIPNVQARVHHVHGALQVLTDLGAALPDAALPDAVSPGALLPDAALPAS